VRERERERRKRRKWRRSRRNIIQYFTGRNRNVIGSAVSQAVSVPVLPLKLKWSEINPVFRLINTQQLSSYRTEDTASQLQRPEG
jgi:hypothetical protein